MNIFKILTTSILLLSICFAVAAQQIQTNKEDTMLVVGYEVLKTWSSVGEWNRYNGKNDIVLEAFVKLPYKNKYKIKIGGGFANKSFKNGYKLGFHNYTMSGWFTKLGIDKNLIANKRHTFHASLVYVLSRYKTAGKLRLGDHNTPWPLANIGEKGVKHGLETKIGWEIKLIKNLFIGIAMRGSWINDHGELVFEEESGLPSLKHSMGYLPGIGYTFRQAHSNSSLGLTATLVYKIDWLRKKNAKTQLLESTK